MFEDCFNIDVGRFSTKIGLDVRILVISEFTGTGFIITLEFFRTGIISYLNTIEVFGPVGINLDALTI